MPFAEGDDGGDQVDEQGGDDKDRAQDIGPNFQKAYLRNVVWVRKIKL